MSEMLSRRQSCGVREEPRGRTYGLALGRETVGARLSSEGLPLKASEGGIPAASWAKVPTGFGTLRGGFRVRPTLPHDRTEYYIGTSNIKINGFGLVVYRFRSIRRSTDRLGTKSDDSYNKRRLFRRRELQQSYVGGGRLS